MDTFATTTVRPPRVLSKSKLLAFRQCPKRLWLEIHRPDLGETSPATASSFAVGHQVGEVARRLYDPKGTGVVIDPQAEGVAAAIARTQTSLLGSAPIFEAGFEAGGARAFADILLPMRKRGRTVWRIDFETVSFAVPIWKGTRPYQQLPFQFSVHRLSRTGTLEAESFLDLSGKDPRRALAESLIRACGTQGPVFVYSPFEDKRIRDLAKRYPKLKPALLALAGRLVDLLPIAEAHYYHPSQQGSWSLKKLLPAVAPELGYDALPGVKDGGMSMTGYTQAIAPETTPQRREQIRQELNAYCGLDTLAMVRLWEFLSGSPRADV